MRKMFLTLFYSGLSPKASGTVGSIVALLMGLAILEYFPQSTLILLAIFIAIVSVKEINKYEQEVGEHDSKEIVIDELVGMWIALAISSGTLTQAILSFVCFRFFDIYKPSIIGRVDRDVKGGLGVVGDDVLAGIFGGLLSAIIYKAIFM
jgi:phosphatidylglycerophosphatase A